MFTQSRPDSATGHACAASALPPFTKSAEARNLRCGRERRCLALHWSWSRFWPVLLFNHAQNVIRKRPLLECANWFRNIGAHNIDLLRSTERVNFLLCQSGDSWMFLIEILFKLRKIRTLPLALRYCSQTPSERAHLYTKAGKLTCQSSISKIIWRKPRLTLSPPPKPPPP